MKQRNPEARCGNCPYFGKCALNHNAAQCKRFPPRALTDNPGFVPIHSDTMMGDVCGEHPEFFLPDKVPHVEPHPTVKGYGQFSCDCGAKLMFPNGITPEQQAVIDEAYKWRIGGQWLALVSAVDTLRASRKAAP